jgi:hypothetical protein
MKVRCRDEILRSIGLERAAFWIGMRNLAYNMGRFVSLKCPKPAKAGLIIVHEVKTCQQLWDAYMKYKVGFKESTVDNYTVNGFELIFFLCVPFVPFVVIIFYHKEHKDSQKNGYLLPLIV